MTHWTPEEPGTHQHQSRGGSESRGRDWQGVERCCDYVDYSQLVFASLKECWEHKRQTERERDSFVQAMVRLQFGLDLEVV